MKKTWMVTGTSTGFGKDLAIEKYQNSLAQFEQLRDLSISADKLEE